MVADTEFNAFLFGFNFISLWLYICYVAYLFGKSSKLPKFYQIICFLHLIFNSSRLFEVINLVDQSNYTYCVIGKLLEFASFSLTLCCYLYLSLSFLTAFPKYSDYKQYLNYVVGFFIVIFLISNIAAVGTHNGFIFSETYCFCLFVPEITLVFRIIMYTVYAICFGCFLLMKKSNTNSKSVPNVNSMESVMFKLNRDLLIINFLTNFWNFIEMVVIYADREFINTLINIIVISEYLTFVEILVLHFYYHKLVEASKQTWVNSSKLPGDFSKKTGKSKDGGSAKGGSGVNQVDKSPKDGSDHKEL